MKILTFYNREKIPFIRISQLHWLKVSPLYQDWLRSLNYKKDYLIELHRSEASLLNFIIERGNCFSIVKSPFPYCQRRYFHILFFINCGFENRKYLQNKVFNK